MKNHYRPRRQYDLTRDALHLIMYLSTSFLSGLTDLIDDSLDHLEQLTARASAGRRPSAQKFEDVLADLYSYLIKDKSDPASAPQKSVTHIIERDLKESVHRLVDGILFTMYGDKVMVATGSPGSAAGATEAIMLGGPRSSEGTVRPRFRTLTRASPQTSEKKRAATTEGGALGAAARARMHHQ